MKQEPAAPIAPPLPGQWHWQSDATRLVLKARLKTASYEPLAFATLAALRVCPLSFYPRWLLCDWQCDDHGFVWASMLYGPDGFTPLDGTSIPMHGHNHKHGVVLDSENDQLHYLQFFTWFVRGDDMPFEIVSNADGLHCTDDNPDATELAALCRPPRLQAADAAGATGAVQHWHANVLFGNVLFESVFAIGEHGLVEMISDDTVAENIERRPALRFDGCMRSDTGAPATDQSPTGEQL